jgi:hypothetical protein
MGLPCDDWVENMAEPLVVLRFMSRRLAGSARESLKTKGNNAQQAQHENPLTEEAENQKSALISGVYVWLPFLDTYRTMCRAPEPVFRQILEDIRELRFAA